MSVQVGECFLDGSMRQVVRTSAGYVYVVAPWMASYETDPTLTNPVRVYKANSTAVPPASFARKDSGNEPQGASTCACGVDASDTIHVAWLAHDITTRTRYLRYAPFNTSTDTWGSVTTILSNLDYDDIGQGDEGVALAIDASGYVHITFLTTVGNGNIAARRLYYTTNASGSWSAAVQVDADVSYSGDYKAWHPGLAFDDHGRLIASWLKGQFAESGTGTVYVRTKESGGSWNSSVSVVASIEDGIDQCVSLMVTADGRYHLGCSTSKSGGWQTQRYFYSDDHGGSWTANHPAGIQTCHNVTLGPGRLGQVRLYYHGNGSPVNIYYVEGTGGSVAWGAETLADSGAYDCSINARWSQYHHAFPSVLDAGWWLSTPEPSSAHVASESYFRTSASLGTLKMGGKAHTAGLTPSATLTRYVNRPVAAGLTPAGAVAKRSWKAIIAGMTPAAALGQVKTKLQALAGGATPAGALARRIGKPLSAGATPAGALSKRSAKGLAGGSTPTGTLAQIKTKLQSLAGGVSSAGTLTRRIGTAVSGALAPAGVLAKRTARGLVGGATPAGALSTSRAILRTLAGSLPSAGVLTRRVTKALTGVLAAAGALTHGIARMFAGTVASAGDLVTAWLPKDWVRWVQARFSRFRVTVENKSQLTSVWPGANTLRTSGQAHATLEVRALRPTLTGPGHGSTLERNP